MSITEYPAEFFTPDELQAMLGHGRARVIASLREAKVPHIIGREGWPLVYRSRLLPGAAQEPHNADPAVIDFAAIHATRRPAAHRAKP